MPGEGMDSLGTTEIMEAVKHEIKGIIRDAEESLRDTYRSDTAAYDLLEDLYRRSTRAYERVTNLFLASVRERATSMVPTKVAKDLGIEFMGLVDYEEIGRDKMYQWKDPSNDEVFVTKTPEVRDVWEGREQCRGDLAAFTEEE